MTDDLLNLWRDGESHCLDDARVYARRIWGPEFTEERFRAEMEAAIIGSEISLDRVYGRFAYLRATPLLLPYRRRLSRSYRLQRAIDWLEWEIREMQPAAAIKRRAVEAGIRPTTLKIAKEYLRVRSVKRGGHFGGDARWWWMPSESKPKNDQCLAEEARI